jgi:hypothetical protein
MHTFLCVFTQVALKVFGLVPRNEILTILKLNGYNDNIKCLTILKLNRLLYYYYTFTL